ncbi:MAG: Smr/MutS family protein [Candidatus Sulfotelmatobacter sp.]
MPPVHEALQRLDRELALARQQKLKLLKIIHGYGSTGVGGDIKIAVQARLEELVRDAQIRGCICGENWSRSDELTWKLLQSNSSLKDDEHLSRRNPGVTIILL